VKRWEAGKNGLSERYRLAYAAAFSMDEATLFGDWSSIVDGHNNGGAPIGMQGYSRSGIMGRPSLGTSEKGKAILDSLVGNFATVLQLFAGP
jgi:creatinine amidohydrolase/Fe(II)-dependent formamide hydrolase-like protein